MKEMDVFVCSKCDALMKYFEDFPGNVHVECGGDVIITRREVKNRFTNPDQTSRHRRNTARVYWLKKVEKEIRDSGALNSAYSWLRFREELQKYTLSESIYRAHKLLPAAPTIESYKKIPVPDGWVISEYYFEFTKDIIRACKSAANYKMFDASRDIHMARRRIASLQNDIVKERAKQLIEAARGVLEYYRLNK